MKTTPFDTCLASLKANGFEVFTAKDGTQARQLFFTQILPALDVKTTSWGGSMTMEATGVLAELMDNPEMTMIKTFDPEAPRDQVVERRRQALLADLFLTGSNALTEDGKVVNLDMIGNRTSAISYGPKNVVLFVGRNKIVPDLAAAIDRIKDHAAPLNAKKLNFPTPCATSGYCHDCNSPKRICNTWSILDKCFPVGRIKIILIDQELGL